MTDMELRIAIAQEGPGALVNLRVDDDGRLLGEVPDMLAELPEIVPNWPGSLPDAMRFERYLEAIGLREEYDGQLAGIAGGTSGATARQRSEAALAVLRSVAPANR